MLKILHVISGLYKHTGGPSESVPGLCSALVRSGCAVSLATLDGPIADSVVKAQLEGVDLYLFQPSFRHTVWHSRDMRRGLPKLVAEADIVHVHGLWQHTPWLGCQLASNLSKPLVVTPRGSLEPVRLQKSRLKKVLAGVLFDNRNLKGAACLHATADSEKSGFRSYSLKNPVAVIPNAVDFSLFDSSPKDSFSLIERFPEIRGKRLLLFLSRINPTKGLLDLAEAWAEMSPKYPDWHLLLVGPDERGHVAEVMQAFNNSCASLNVTYGGTLLGSDRAEILRKAELFVLPTHNENFGIAIAEALGMGLPVITTHGAPWKGIEEYRCGWWVPVGKAGLVEGLEQGLSASAETLKEAGLRGRTWVRQDFTWNAVAEQMITVYQWLLNKGPRPECVSLD